MLTSLLLLKSTNRFWIQQCYHHFFGCFPTDRAFSFGEQRQKIHPCLDGVEEFAYNVPERIELKHLLSLLEKHAFIQMFQNKT